MNITIKYCATYDKNQFTLFPSLSSSHPRLTIVHTCISLHLFDKYTSKCLVRKREKNLKASKHPGICYRKLTFCPAARSLNVCSPPPPSHSSSSGNCPPRPTLSQKYHLQCEQMQLFPWIKGEPLR